MLGRWRKTLLLLFLLAVSAALVLRRAGRLTPEEAARRLERGAALLDVRTAGEFSREHVRGAINVPLRQLPSRLDEIPRDRPLLVMCERGPRSLTAAALLTAAGIPARPVKGGPGAWPAFLLQ